MLVILAIFLGVIALSAGLAVLGARIGAQMEAKSLGSGLVEERMRGGMSANVLGGLLGMIPFAIFVIVLVVMVITSPDTHEAAPGAPAAAAAH